MQQEKKKILDEVTETETYKKAKEILMKFAPDQLRMTPVSFIIFYSQCSHVFLYLFMVFPFFLFQLSPQVRIDYFFIF